MNPIQEDNHNGKFMDKLYTQKGFILSSFQVVTGILELYQQLGYIYVSPSSSIPSFQELLFDIT